MDNFYVYIDKIQLLFIFINSFLLSRVLVVTKVPERLVLYLIGKQHLPISRISLYVIAASALLSFFIPNVITVLALLPILKILCDTFEESLPLRYREIETLLPLALIYGANIGGMGSITGTPANGIMVVYATLYNLPGVEYLTFENWLLWGVPIVCAFVIMSWLLLTLYFRLWTYDNDLVRVIVHETDACHPLQKIAVKITLLFFLLSILLSILIKTSGQQIFILGLTGSSSLVLILLLFIIPIRSPLDHIPRRMLHMKDCYSNLPWRGILVLGVIVLLLGIGALLNIQKYILLLFQAVFQQDYSPVMLYLVVAALTAFSTELFSNTVVQIAMFIVMRPLCEASSLVALQTFLIITLSCTSAFMTPIATGVNGLAFGEMKGISFSRMMIVGLLMKISSILMLAFGVPWLFSLAL
ncbi:hypothetical protein CSB45_00700 [candidate division KSB3 bacterium]|uniref:Citrate transporter-like domain-containing protein n=1 Tax=candidate division KSB3 bacterium TaxID=2044937 RepID=A0A2G6EDX3_9BACT|nr:MAG: hypothetical protein CSB45_00700 [candidate division KSB3 bacterium]PIE31023.1 MAG: hypothetical protein CSA57_01520 [candidate division KSB3 bacterium]